MLQRYNNENTYHIVTYIFSYRGEDKMFIPFSIFWFILTISVTNSFIPRIDILSERNLYLPAIGPAFLISFIFYNCLVKQSSIRF